MKRIFSTIADNSALVSGSALFTADNDPAAAQLAGIFYSIIVGDCDLAMPIVFAGNAQGSVETPGDTCTLSQSFNMVSVSASDLKLGNLAHYGGPTKTHDLFAGSVAIDLIPVGGLCPSRSSTTQDQRGLSRVFDADGDAILQCDAGAIESQPLSIFADGLESGDTSKWSSSAP